MGTPDGRGTSATGFDDQGTQSLITVTVQTAETLAGTSPSTSARGRWCSRRGTGTAHELRCVPPHLEAATARDPPV